MKRIFLCARKVLPTFLFVSSKRISQILVNKGAKRALFLLIFMVTACAATTPAAKTDDFIVLPTTAPRSTPAPTSVPDFVWQPTSSPAPEPELIDEIDIAINAMTLHEKIGQLFICRLPAGTTVLNAATKQLMDEFHVGGFILFGENVQSIEQVRTLTRDLQAHSPRPLFIATDEEGGRVSRVGKLYTPAIQSALRMGKMNDPQFTYDAYQTIGERLVDLGINMDFAPVADIWSNEANTVIGDRAFGEDAASAAVMVAEAVRALQDTGVLSVVKHFPGHGDTVEDSHHKIAVYNHDRQRFVTVESIPFKHGINAGSAGVMVGHIATPLMQNESPALDWMEPWHTKGRLPATFSDYWLTDVLRDEWNYEGLIITDALDMGALTSDFNAGQIAVGAFMAGADILLIPTDVKAAAAALVAAYENGTITDERLDKSVRRILTVK